MGADKESSARQESAVTSYVCANGVEIVEAFYNARPLTISISGQASRACSPQSLETEPSIWRTMRADGVSSRHTVGLSGV